MSKNNNQIKVLHTVPGRVRLRAPSLRHQATLAQQIQASLKELEGIRAHHTCASVAVSYTPDKTTNADILAHLKSLFPPAPSKQAFAVACSSCQQNGSQTESVNQVRRAGLRF